MKKKTVLALSGVAIISLSFWYFKTEKAEHMTVPETWVGVTKVEVRSLPQEISVIGSLEAKTVMISPELAGHLDALYFSDGQEVAKGARLVHLEDQSYEAKYKASLADYEYKKNNFKRLKLLSQKSLVSKDTMDQANAALQQKRAEMQANQNAFKKMTLYAPFSGVLGKAKVHQGDYVNVGSSIVSLTDHKNLRVLFAVPEDYVAKLKLGQSVKVKSKAFPDQTFAAKIAYISPTVSVENRSIQLYANVQDPNNQLKPGMFVNVTQVLGENDKAVMIPSKSLVPILGGEQVFKVVDGKAYAVSVTLGQRHQDDVQVLEGVVAGDLVVTDGQIKLHNGSPVKIKS